MLFLREILAGLGRRGLWPLRRVQSHLGARLGAHFAGPGWADGQAPPRAAPPTAPTRAEWAACRPMAVAADPAAIDIVMPAYRGHAETLRAIQRVLSAANQAPARLTVIDDASPDEQLRRDLREISAGGLFRLESNDRNRGFVATANRGMRLSPAGHDVLLLNSDTEVFDFWLDRLRTAVRAGPATGPATGTVTPLSNAATILSYPIWLVENHSQLELTPRQMDALARECGGRPAPIPTAIGFCMLIRRECLDQVGLFDEAAFGHGYGEENDFCLRAEARGWQHVAATDTFVWHWGGTSFADQRTPRVAEAMRTIARMHPTYLKRIADYIEANPLAAVRQALDIARLRRAAPGYLLTDAPDAAKPRAREGVLLMRPDASGPGLLLSAPGVKLTPNLPVLNPALDFGATVDALRAIGVTGIAVQDTTALPAETVALLRRCAESLGARWGQR